MKKYLFNVLVAAGVVAAQVYGYGFNEDDALVDACFNMSSSDVPEDSIEDIKLVSVEFV